MSFASKVEFISSLCTITAYVSKDPLSFRYRGWARIKGSSGYPTLSGLQLLNCFLKFILMNKTSGNQVLDEYEISSGLA